MKEAKGESAKDDHEQNKQNPKDKSLLAIWNNSGHSNQAKANLQRFANFKVNIPGFINFLIIVLINVIFR